MNRSVMVQLGSPITKLMEELRKIPSIGQKSAQRICFFLLKKDKRVALELAEAIVNAREKTFLCSICYNITSQDPCEICADKERDQSQICVVEEPFNIISIEKTNLYRGLYHVLHGNLSPIKGIGPEELKISGLKKRLEGGTVEELILATSPTTEGNATAHYITEMLRGSGVQFTRIALGLPIGSDIDYVDSVTIARAIESRTKI